MAGIGGKDHGWNKNWQWSGKEAERTRLFSPCVTRDPKTGEITSRICQCDIEEAERQEREKQKALKMLKGLSKDELDEFLASMRTEL